MGNGDCGTKGGRAKGRMSTGEKLLRRRLEDTVRHYALEAERSRETAARFVAGDLRYATLRAEYEARAIGAEGILDDLCRTLGLSDAQLPPVVVAYRAR